MQQTKRSLKTIGVGGQKQNGKDTLADYLATKLWRQTDLEKVYETWGRNSFAAEVKRFFCETFFFAPQDIDKWKVLDEPPPGFNKPVREGLTMIGDGFREIMSDVWIRRAFRDETCLYKVLSDIRYLNEARKIRDVGGPMFLICHPNRVNYTHNRSEAELRPYIEWCLEVGKEGLISSWPEFQAGIQSDNDGILTFSPDKDGPNRGVYVEIPAKSFFRNLSLFDVFIRNEGTMDDLYKKVDSLVVPYIHKNFEYTEAA